MLFELNISKLDKTSGGDKQKDLFSLFLDYYWQSGTFIGFYQEVIHFYFPNIYFAFFLIANSEITCDTSCCGREINSFKIVIL